MIYIGETPLCSDSSSTHQENDTLAALMENPVVASAIQSFKDIPERNFSDLEGSASERSTQHRHVYVFQREYATVRSELVDFVGTDEATTCVGLVIRNRRSGMTSVAHMDSPSIVDIGLTQMLSLIVDEKLEAELDVHIVGAFEDVPPKYHKFDDAELAGHSYPLCSKIVETLRKREEVFHIQTLCILGNNTRRDSEGNAYPIFTGLMVETSTGSAIPAKFDRTTRVPDETVRRLRLHTSFSDSRWNGMLLETYDTQTDMFKIFPSIWNNYFVNHARKLIKLPDYELLHNYSTSPLAEAPDFVDNEKRKLAYVIKNPDWGSTFPGGQPRVFARSTATRWIRVSETLVREEQLQSTSSDH